MLSGFIKRPPPENEETLSPVRSAINVVSSGTKSFPVPPPVPSNVKLVFATEVEFDFDHVLVTSFRLKIENPFSKFPGVNAPNLFGTMEYGTIMVFPSGEIVLSEYANSSMFGVNIVCGVSVIT